MADRNYDVDKTMVDFSELQGKVITKIVGLEAGSDKVIFYCADGDKFSLTYYDDCCASCSIAELEGDMEDLLNTPILLAAEESSHESYNGKPEHPDSFTWVFYKLGTVKGYVDMRWLGQSNGYYSESATFEKYKKLGKARVV